MRRRRLIEAELDRKATRITNAIFQGGMSLVVLAVGLTLVYVFEEEFRPLLWGTIYFTGMLAGIVVGVLEGVKRD